MRRLYLCLDDRLSEAVEAEAKKKGIPPASLVVSNLEDLYLKEEAIDYEALLKTIMDEAQNMPLNQPFLLADLPSFSKLIITSSAKAHVSSSPVRARIGKSFNAAVRAEKVPNIIRAVRENGKLLNRGGVAMYVRVSGQVL